MVYLRVKIMGERKILLKILSNFFYCHFADFRLLENVCMYVL